jgi:uncharacterized protein (DUF488 family)
MQGVITLWTIGHSTSTSDEFLALLRAHGIALLIDVRTIPRSRHNPQYNSDTLAQSLHGAGLQYRHMPDLGGRRKTKEDSINQGWQNASFRGYADYMQAEAFWRALDELMVFGQGGRTAIMCAEAVPWRCHRSLIADALVSRGRKVRHIISAAEAQPHQLTSFAKIENGILTYPEPTDTPLLF